VSSFVTWPATSERTKRQKETEMSGHSASAEKSGHSANKRNSDICETIGLQILSQQDLEETL